jgi:hypothetical protein
MSQSVLPLRIEIGGPGSESFKSIDYLVWDDIPPFAVLTGLNGSGKTQLLELLAHRLTNTPHRQGDISAVRVVTSGEPFGPEAVAYLPSNWDIGGIPAISLAQMPTAKNDMYSRLRRIAGSSEMAVIAQRARLEKLLGVQIDELTAEQFAERVPSDFSFMLDDSDVTSGLVHHFMSYRLRYLAELERRTPESEILGKLGPAPWELINETIQAAEYPFRVISPPA